MAGARITVLLKIKSKNSSEHFTDINYENKFFIVISNYNNPFTRVPSHTEHGTRSHTYIINTADPVT
jgi:hypothetical protein